MLVTIRDPQILKALEPNRLRAYLQAHGWQEKQPLKNHASLWDHTTTSGEFFEILLLENPEFSDYSRRMYELLETLETVESRSQLTILQDLISRLPNYNIQGLITNLNESNTLGKVTLLGIVLNQLQRIQLELPEPTYELALQAYRARLPVLCNGDLQRISYGFELTNIRQFTLDLTAWNGSSTLVSPPPSAIAA
jgi:hypothetical protein